MGNIRAEEASGAEDDRGGLLELLDLVVEGDTLVVTHIDRLSRGLTYGLQRAAMSSDTLPPEVLETMMRCVCLYCKGMRMMVG